MGGGDLRVRAWLATGLIVCAAFAMPASAAGGDSAHPSSTRASSATRSTTTPATARASPSTTAATGVRPPADASRTREQARRSRRPRATAATAAFRRRRLRSPGPGADSNGDIALDVNLALPDPRRIEPPKRGYPLLVMMHGCCGGQATSHDQRTVDGSGLGRGLALLAAVVRLARLRGAHLHLARLRQRVGERLDRRHAPAGPPLRDERPAVASPARSPTPASTRAARGCAPTGAAWS